MTDIFFICVDTMIPCDDNILLQTLNDPEMYSIGVADVEHSGSKEVGAVEGKLSEYLV